MKNTMLFKLIAILLMIAIASEALSQFVISAELRPRAEYRDGFSTLVSQDDNPAIFISQRTRLNLAYKTNRFKTYLSLQDVRVWGSQKQLVMNEDNAFSIHEAWAEVYFGKSNVFSGKLGRQEISIDDQRIFGGVGWAQQARSHDALILKYTNPKIVDINVGLAYNYEKFSITGITYNKGYKTFQYLWLNKKILDNKLAISLLFLNKGDEVTNVATTKADLKIWNNYTQTIGTHSTYKIKDFKIGLNAYYQTGAMATYSKTAKPDNLSAYLIGLDMSYKIKKVTLGLGYELQSGNSQTDTAQAYSETNHAFTPFFGTNHKFNGHMDYFYVGNHGKSVGLQDIYFKAKYTSPKFYIGGDFHAFLSAAAVYDKKQLENDPTLTFADQTKAGGSYLGSEIDLYLGFPITKGVDFKMGHSTMFGTESMEALKGGDRKQFTNWAYMQVVIKPTFFDSSKYQLKKKKKEFEVTK